jgi:hypothetical protein
MLTPGSDVFSPSQLDAEAAHALIQRMTDVLDRRSSAYIERLHAESLHHKAAMELAKTEADSHRRELERREEAHAAVRSELHDARERAETAELKLDVHQRSRTDVEADIEAQLARMSALHEVELSGPQVERLQAEVQHLTLQLLVAEETSGISEREAAQHSTAAEQKHRAHEIAQRELDEARSQHERAQHQAAVELATTRKQAETHLARVRSEHATHVEQMGVDHRAVADARDELQTVAAEHEERVTAAVQAAMATKDEQHLAVAEALRARHDENIKSTHAAITAEHTEVAEQLRNQHAEAVAEHTEAAEQLRKQHEEELASQLSNLKATHSEDLAGQLSSVKAEVLESARAAHAQELDKVHGTHAEVLGGVEDQYVALQEAKASVDADKIVLAEQLRALQELHAAEISRAEMLSAAHAERLSRENESATWQRTQMVEAHAAEMATKDAALREAQSGHETVARDLAVAKGEIEAQNKLLQQFIPDGEDIDPSEAAGKQYERLKLAYDALALKFAQTQERAASDSERARARAEEQETSLAHQSRMIVTLQGQNEKHEAEILSANSEMVTVRAALAAALVDSDKAGQQGLDEHSQAIEAKDTQIQELEAALRRMEGNTAALQAELKQAAQRVPAPAPASAPAPAPTPDGTRVTISMMQGPTGFGLDVSDTLHVERLSPGSTAERAGVPMPSKLVEVAGHLVNTKRELKDALTMAASGPSGGAAPAAAAAAAAELVSFVFLTEDDHDSRSSVAAAEATAATEAAQSQKLSTEMLLLKEMHAMELAERDAVHESALRKAKAHHTAAVEAHETTAAELRTVRQAHEALEEEMMLSEEASGGFSMALRQAQSNLADKDQLHRAAVAEVAAWKETHATLQTESSDLEAAHFEELMTLKEESERNLEEAGERARAAKEAAVRRAEETAAAELSAAQAAHLEAQGDLAKTAERLRLTQLSHEALEAETLDASERAANEAERLRAASAELSGQLDAERKRHAATELSLKQAHSTALADHTERVRLLQLGYDRLDEDFLAASANAQENVEEAARLKTKLAACLRQTAELERSHAREKAARTRAETVQAELQQSLQESESRYRLAAERSAAERSALLDKKKECAKLEERLRILGLQQERLEDEVLEAQVLVERKGLEALSVREQWQATILSRVHTGVLSWAFVTWSAAASVQREDARREEAELAVRQSMKQFHTQVATMRQRIDT